MPQTLTVLIPDDADARLLGEIYKAIAALLLQQEPDAGGADARAQSSGDPEPPSTTLTDDDVRRFLGGITTNARRLVRAVALESAEGGVARATDVREFLGVPSDGTLGGWAASIGFAAKRLELAKPYQRSWRHTDDDGWESVYEMKPQVAEVVLATVDDMGRLRD
jgi:hypothetical protein